MQRTNFGMGIHATTFTAENAETAGNFKLVFSAYSATSAVQDFKAPTAAKVISLAGLPERSFHA